jgi:AraC-like DNA-binding protein
MSITSTPLACGSGWRVDDVVCTAGPRNRPFEERHDAVCIAAVTAGSFHYRSRTGAATMSPGSLLLGNPGTCFECGHEHATGDRCLAFHYAPDYFETIAADIPGARASFDRPQLPPLAALTPLFAAAELARQHGDGEEFEELALRLAGAAIALEAGSPAHARWSGGGEARGIVAALRLIEAGAAAPLTLAVLAREAAMSRFHFVRAFRRTVGLTPHQYVLRTRLLRAAVRLRRSDDPVTVIALESGFGDLSTFVRRFRTVMGSAPTRYRSEGRSRSGRKIRCGP